MGSLFTETVVYTILEVIGLITGLIYLYFEYKADRRVWIYGIIMPCISMILYFSKGLYADFGINVYYLIAAFYGLSMWRQRKDRPVIPISHIRLIALLLSGLCFGVMWCLIYWVLVIFTDSTVPLADSFTTALSIVGLWMLARKYVEQWILWVVVDTVSVLLYYYKGLYLYGSLYFVYTIVAVAGYFKWIRLMNEMPKDRS